jgi:hypothetical protein
LINVRKRVSNPRVIDEDIEAPELISYSGKERGDGTAIPNIAGMGDDAGQLAPRSG